MREIERKLLMLERAVRKEMLREVREMDTLSRIKLHRRARRNKRLMHRALRERRSYEYAARRALSREYGRVISIKMRQV
jgi:hypothetical protein